MVFSFTISGTHLGSFSGNFPKSLDQVFNRIRPSSYFSISGIWENRIKYFFVPRKVLTSFKWINRKNLLFIKIRVIKADIYLFKVNNGNRAMCEICSKLEKTPDRRHRCRSDVFIVNFEHNPDVVLVFVLLTLNQ